MDHITTHDEKLFIKESVLKTENENYFFMNLPNRMPPQIVATVPVAIAITPFFVNLCFCIQDSALASLAKDDNAER